MPYDMLYSAGTWVPSHATAVIDVENPATETVIGAVPRGDAADIDRAVSHARAALPDWSRTPWTRRQALLRAIASDLLDQAEHTASTIVAELGMPLDATLSVQAREPAAIFDSYADEMDVMVWEEQIASSLVVREPIGVVAAITPWNYPLYQIACKVGAALAAGCTVVLKPSELTPLNAYALMHAVEKAGLPPGVVNLVTGLGSEAGEALVAHPDVDAVSFTGSTTAGRRIASVAGAALTRLTLELGGKSASVVLDGADLEFAVAATLRNCLRNSGQTCSAHSRLLVPRAQHHKAVEVAADHANQWALGDPTVSGDHLGPLASRTQRDRVRSYIDAGAASGARLVAGGSAVPQGFEQGYYVRPTVFGDVDPASVISQEEIFGPVLCVLAYDGVDDAVRIANSTPYGLSAGVWSGGEAEGLDVARRLSCGEVQINGAPFNVRAPFGGRGLSGYGRELGAYGIEEFLTTKAVHLSTSTRIRLGIETPCHCNAAKIT
jgi:aldehyde dehydrogenase (NAD+)